MAKTYVGLGAGPGLGLATARRFGEAGFATVLVGRRIETVEAMAAQLRSVGQQAESAAVDISDSDALSELIGQVGSSHGHIDVLHFNPSVWRAHDVLTLTPAELLADLAVGVAPLLSAVRASVDFMSPGARVLVTGSMAADLPSVVAPSLGVQKAGLRNLVLSVDASLAERGIRAVTVQIEGSLAETGPFAPEAVAEALFAAATAPAEDWQVQVSYDGRHEF